MAVFNGTINSDYIVGSDENDEIYGGLGNDWLEGGAGDDIIDGGDGWNKILAGDGNDIIIASRGYIDGGNGIDTLDASGEVNSVAVSLTDTSGYGKILDSADLLGSIVYDFSIRGVENVIGGAGWDYLVGNSANNELTGNGGIDNIRGGAGDDIIYGGSGADYLLGEDGNDILHGGTEDDNLYGGDGDDTLNGDAGDDWLMGEAGADILDGGLGINTTSYETSDAGVTVDLTLGTGLGGHAEGDTLTNVQRLIGSAFDDNFTGNDENNFFKGGEGADFIDGRGGVNTVSYENAPNNGQITVNLEEGTITGGYATGDVLLNIQNVIGTQHRDKFYGQDGVDNYFLGGTGTSVSSWAADKFYSSTGNNIYDGGDGTGNTLYYTFSESGVTAHLDGTEGLGGDAEGDRIFNMQYLYGSNFGDNLYGNSENNRIYGQDGDDIIYGIGGDNILDGGNGNNTIYGGSGNDSISVGSGENVIYTGEGDNTVSTGAGNNIVYGGSGNNTIKTYQGDDVIIGGDGDEIIQGRSGVDTLTGGGGNDVFSFTAWYDSSTTYGIDTITDFTQGEDLLQFSTGNFVSQFQSDTVWTDFVVDTSSGTHTVITNVNRSSFELHLDGIYTLTEADFDFI